MDSQPPAPALHGGLSNIPVFRSLIRQDRELVSDARSSKSSSTSILGRIERRYLILTAMAGRIKYLFLNSAKSGTAGFSEPNSIRTPQLSEPNSIHTPQLSEPNGTDNNQESPSLRLAEGGEKSEQSGLDKFFEVTTESPTGQKGASSGPSKDDDDADDDSHEEEDGDDAKNSYQAETGEANSKDSPEGSAEESDSTQQSDGATSYTTTPSISSLPDPVSKEELVNAQRPSEMVDGPLRGVAYYRTSTEEENENDARITIDQQKPLVDAAFKAFNVEQAHKPIKDRAISGEIFEDRPGLEKIEELCKNDVVNVVIVSDIDRLGRICEKTIGFVKRLRYEYDTYVISNVRWYDVADGDDLETFNAKAGRAEAENKKRGGRGNRGKLFKLLEYGSESYLSWFNTIPTACVKADSDHGIELATDARREIPKLAIDEFRNLDVDRNEYAATEERVRQRLQEEFNYEYEGELDIKSILQDPIYTGSAVLHITKAETHSVDQAEIRIPMPELRVYDEEYIEKWEQVQDKIAELDKKYRDKQGNRPETLLDEFGPQMVDETLATWTLICPKCGSTSDYSYYGFTEDVDGTRRQKCKCTGSDKAHFFRVPTREEWERFHSDGADKD